MRQRDKQTEIGRKNPLCPPFSVLSFPFTGELWAFVVGWNLLLENWLSSAAVARAWSGNVDAILGGVIKAGINETIGFMPETDYLSQYPDLLALCSLHARDRLPQSIPQPPCPRFASCPRQTTSVNTQTSLP